MESTNGQVRLVPGTSAKNGYPERRNYVYRGTGEDTMPEAITADRSVDYESGGEVRRMPPRGARNRCASCGHDYRGRKHRTECR